MTAICCKKLMPIRQSENMADENVAMEICDHPEEYAHEQVDWGMDFLKFSQPPYHDRFEKPFEIRRPLQRNRIEHEPIFDKITFWNHNNSSLGALVARFGFLAGGIGILAYSYWLLSQLHLMLGSIVMLPGFMIILAGMIPDGSKK